MNKRSLKRIIMPPRAWNTSGREIIKISLRRCISRSKVKYPLYVKCSKLIAEKIRLALNLPQAIALQPKPANIMRPSAVKRLKNVKAISYILYDFARSRLRKTVKLNWLTIFEKLIKGMAYIQNFGIPKRSIPIARMIDIIIMRSVNVADI